MLKDRVACFLISIIREISNFRLKVRVWDAPQDHTTDMKYIIKTSESPEVNSAQTTIEKNKGKVYENDPCVEIPNTIKNRHYTLLGAKRSAILMTINMDKKFRSKKY